MTQDVSTNARKIAQKLIIAFFENPYVNSTSMQYAYFYTQLMNVPAMLRCEVFAFFLLEFSLDTNNPLQIEGTVECFPLPASISSPDEFHTLFFRSVQIRYEYFLDILSSMIRDALSPKVVSARLLEILSGLLLYDACALLHSIFTSNFCPYVGYLLTYKGSAPLPSDDRLLELRKKFQPQERLIKMLLSPSRIDKFDGSFEIGSRFMDIFDDCRTPEERAYVLSRIIFIARHLPWSLWDVETFKESMRGLFFKEPDSEFDA